MRAHRSALLMVCFLLPACATQTPALKASSVASMQRDAVDSVSITLGPVALGFLRAVGSSDGHTDPHSAAEMSLLRGLHKVEVHSYQFATNHTYSQADLQALRSQFTTPHWQPVMQTRSGGSDGDVDIYCAVKNHTITRLAIIAAEPREFAFIKIAGAIDPDQIGTLRDGFVPHKQAQSRLVSTAIDKERLERN